jgi:hypothetical protein
VFDSRRAGQPIPIAQCSASQRQIDILVVQEVALVEGAGCPEERCVEQNRPAREDSDIGRCVVGPCKLTCSNVDAGPVSTDRDPEAVDPRRVGPGGDEHRLSRSDPLLPEFGTKWLEPAHLDHDIVVKDCDLRRPQSDRPLDPDVRGRAVSMILHAENLNIDSS